MLWLVLAGWSLFALTWFGLHAWIVPRIGEWRPDLERWASSAVGVVVRVGDIRADGSGQGRTWLPALMPSFELRDVQLIDSQGRVALQLPLIRTSISARSLWRGGFEQIVIERPVLDVRRTAQGRIEVAGLDLAGPGEGDTRAADWFFSQSEFVIHDGTLRWTDDLRSQPPLALEQLDLVARNTALTHQFRIDATPPPEWGERLSLRGRLREPLLDLNGKRTPNENPWHHWSGEVFADFTHVDVERLRAYVDLSNWGVEVGAGRGALRAWADVAQGQLTGVTADLLLQGVQAQLGPQLPVLAIEDLQGRLAAALVRRRLRTLHAKPGLSHARWRDLAGRQPAPGAHGGARRPRRQPRTPCPTLRPCRPCVHRQSAAAARSEPWAAGAVAPRGPGQWPECALAGARRCGAGRRRGTRPGQRHLPGQRARRRPGALGPAQRAHVGDGALSAARPARRQWCHGGLRLQRSGWSRAP